MLLLPPGPRGLARNRAGDGRCSSRGHPQQRVPVPRSKARPHGDGFGPAPGHGQRGRWGLKHILLNHAGLWQELRDRAGADAERLTATENERAATSRRYQRKLGHRAPDSKGSESKVSRLSASRRGYGLQQQGTLRAFQLGPGADSTGAPQQMERKLPGLGVNGLGAIPPPQLAVLHHPGRHPGGLRRPSGRPPLAG